MAITLKEAERDIRRERPHIDRKPYSSNIIACNLRMVAEEHGKDAANGLIEKCKLEKHGWQKEE